MVTGLVFDVTGIIPDATDVFEATGEQVQMWQYQNGFAGERDPQLLTIDMLLERPDIESVKRSVELLIRRHEGLRTYFGEVGGKIMQYVVPYDEELFRTYRYDVSGEPNIRQSVAALLSENKAILKDLRNPPLIRSCLFKIAPESYYVCLLMHHIISDEWSKSLILAELTAVYESLVTGRGVDGRPHKMQLRHYSAWQKEWLEHNGHSGREYWTGKLNYFEQGLFFERLRERHKSIFGEQRYDDNALVIREGQQLLKILTSAGAGYFSHWVNSDRYGRLSKLALSCGCGLLSVLISSLKLMIFCLAGRRRTLIAMPVVSRSWPGGESVIGYLVGGVYLYQETMEEMTILDFMKESFLDLLESGTHLIWDYAAMGLDETELRLNCDVWVNFISKEMAGDKNMGTEATAGHSFEEAATYYALAYYVTEYEDGLKCTWKYNTNLYPQAIMDFIINAHARLLDVIAETPAMTVRDLATRLGHLYIGQ